MATLSARDDLHSFDSSAVDESRAAGLTTNGGITLGSMADSFNSEDYDQPHPNLVQTKNWGRGKGRDLNDTEEFSSILDEEEDRTDTGAIEDDDEMLDHAPGYEHGRQSSGGTMSRPASRSSGGRTSRLASSSTNPTTLASSSRPASRATKLVSSVVEEGDDQEVSREESVGVGERSSVLRDLEASGSESWSASRLAQAGKKKEKEGPVAGQRMTLREQEKVIDEFKKENFDLKLKIHFYEQRLDKLTPEHIDSALRENIQFKIEFQTLRTELKKYKKLLLEGDKAIAELTKENEGGKWVKELQRAKLREQREKEAREKAESRVEELKRELKEEREKSKKKRGGGSDWEGEDSRAEIARLRAEVDAERDAREDLLGDNDDLRAQVRGLEDQLDEVNERLQDGSGLSQSVGGFGEGRRGKDKEARREIEKLSRKIGDLEQDNASLRSQITAQVTMLASRNAEKESLKEEVENLKLDINHLENERAQSDRARARSERSMEQGDDKTNAELERENDEYRDRASQHALELDRLEKLLEEKEREIEELLEDMDGTKADHEAVVKQVEEEWRDEVEEARAAERDAKDALDEKEAEAEELAEKVESLLRDLAEKEAEMQADAEEVEALTDDLKKLGAQIFALEEEGDIKDAKIRELETELDAVDKELEDKQSVHDQVVDALKEKLKTAKAGLGDANIQLESALKDNSFLREQAEEFALRTGTLEEKSRADLESKRKLEDEAEELMRALRKEEDERDLDQQEWNRQRREEEAKWQKAIAEKERDLQNVQSQLGETKGLLTVREADLQRLQEAFNSVENETRRLGESHTNDRFSLELELDRVKRDLARYEDDLKREKAESEKRRDALRERDMALATAQSENKDLETQLAAQTQTRLSVTEKFDVTSKTLRDAQNELSAARDRLRVVEDQLSNDQRNLSRTENQYRDQLTERNTLLLTVYQYMDRMVGAGDRSPRRPGQAEPKPFTNFNVFHDSLLSRVKNVNSISQSFDRRAKEMEARFSDQFNTLKRQQDTKLRQLDRFESSIKTAAETQKQWRQRVATKQAELDSAKSTTAELQTQLAALRQRAAVPGTDFGTSAKMSVLTTRASTAERRLAATQAQLADAEEKLGQARTKIGVAEGKWEARLRELETRLHAAEERVKRERQGAKERISELSGEIKSLEGQVTVAKRRDHLLDDVLKEAAGFTIGSP